MSTESKRETKQGGPPGSAATAAEKGKKDCPIGRGQMEGLNGPRRAVYLEN